MIKSAKGSISRVLAIRLPPGKEILSAMESECKKNNITNGIILSAIGSLDGAKFFTPVALDTKAGYGYSDPIVLEGPIELLNATGMITHDENNEPSFHIHCSFSDSEGKGYGGHLIPGNKVLLTVDMVIGEIEGIDMIREFDEDLEVPIFNPKQL